MHGRLKVKTTEEQQEAKRKEREKKLLLYNGATKKLFQKRKDGELDQDMLSISGEVLGANPDFYTLWNMRREVYTHFLENKSTEDMKALFKSELSFLEHCLRVNPKSYGTWQQRCWVMDHMPEPDWKRDLVLCNKFLEMDERNFHCWDYRRFVVKRSQVPPEDEFEFTNQKITTNFSNYSSWHYRSKLMPHIYPDETHPVGVQEDVLLKEFELVQNAFFTDPGDQSAWFYHRWLLGRRERPLTIDTLYINKAFQKLVIVFSKSTKNPSIKLVVDEREISVELEPVPTNTDHSQLWICDLASIAFQSPSRIDVTIGDSSRFVILGKDEKEGWYQLRQEVKLGNLFSLELSAATTSVLEQELDSCQQLHDLEPDNKWAMLTILSLMRALDPIKYEQQTLEFIDKLKIEDPYRSNYYLDLRSKFLIENAIEKLTISPDQPDISLDLSNNQLTTLYHQNYMVLLTKLNISNNPVPTLKNCHFLQRLRVLDASSSKIYDCSGLEDLPMLEELDISDNSINSVDDLTALTSCPQLKRLRIQGSPVCNIDGFRETVVELLPDLTHLNGDRVK
ncbi:geranylgeranyl transferase type-2 subunit alpha-like [Lineus longissimus]|uniref:geranylgeranyl transferase type-2 subunit alpha-like n=1 Tax=Lineus longissimus TaxID=88925 RepID=UPI002B4CEAED